MIFLGEKYLEHLEDRTNQFFNVTKRNDYNFLTSDMNYGTECLSLLLQKNHFVSNLVQFRSIMIHNYDNESYLRLRLGLGHVNMDISHVHNQIKI